MSSPDAHRDDANHIAGHHGLHVFRHVQSVISKQVKASRNKLISSILEDTERSFHRQVKVDERGCDYEL